MGNHTNAYAQVQPDNYSVANTIAQQTQFNLQRKEQKLREQEFEYKKEKDEKDERRKDAKEFWDNAKQIELTGLAPIDELAIDLMDQTMNDNLKIYKDMMSGKISKAEADVLMMKNNSVPARFKAVTQSYKSEIEAVQNKLSKGEIVATPELSRFLKGLSSGKATMRRNSDGTFDLLYDADGDGEIDVITEKEFMSKKFTPELIQNVDPRNWAMDMAKTVGIEEKKWSEGNVDRHTKFAKEGAVDNTLDAELRNNGKLKGALYALGFEDYNNPSQESITRLHGYLKNFVNDGLNTLDSSQKDRANELRRAEFEYKKQQDAEAKAEKQKETKTKLSEGVTPTKQGWGESFKDVDVEGGVKSVSIPGGIKIPSFNGSTKVTQGKKTTTKNYNIQNPVVNKYTYSSDGRMLIDVEFETSNVVNKKEVKTNERKIVFASKETEANIAKQNGVSVQELRERANYTSKNMSELPNIDDLPNL